MFTARYGLGLYTYIILHSAHTVYLCVLCGSENKQRLFPSTELTDWFYKEMECLLRGTDRIFRYESGWFSFQGLSASSPTYNTTNHINDSVCLYKVFLVSAISVKVALSKSQEHSEELIIIIFVWTLNYEQKWICFQQIRTIYRPATTVSCFHVQVQVKQFHYRPQQALSGSRSWTFSDFKTIGLWMW